MANTKMLFLGAEGTGTENNELECYCNVNDDIYITILDNSNPRLPERCSIALDKNTAVKLSRELRRQIALIQGEEINNG